MRHAPELAGGRIEGSVQLLLGETTTIAGNSEITLDLLVPGTPAVRLNGAPSYGGTVDGDGAATPANYEIILKGTAALRHVVRRTDPVTLAAALPPPLPAGTQNIRATNASQVPVALAAVRDLTLSAQAGNVAVPPGTYGDFAANAGCGFILGVSGSPVAAAYNFQRLTIGAGAELRVVGPVLLTVANGSSNGGAIGTATDPARIRLRFAFGSFTASGGAAIHADIEAPNGTVALSGNARLAGAVASDRLSVNGNAVLRALAPARNNQPPSVMLSAPANGAVYAAPASFALAATAADSDGSVARVSFHRDGVWLGDDATAPYESSVVGLPGGSYRFVARAFDNEGATTDSAPVTVTVTATDQPPVVVLRSPIAGMSIASFSPITFAATATDADGTIASVDFYQNGRLLGAGTLTSASTYTLVVPSGLAPGSYTITARGRDNSDAVTESAGAAILIVARLPYTADFESAEGYVAASLDGQLGWQVASGSAAIVEGSAYSGSRWVAIAPSTTLAQVTQTFAPLTGEPVIFVELFARPVADADLGLATTFDIDSARFALRKEAEGGRLHVLTGDGVGAGTWQPTAFAALLGADGTSVQWLRFTVRLDFTAKRWDLYANGALVAVDVPFRDATRSALGTFVVHGHPTVAGGFDYFFAAATNPLFADADKDGIDDAWELQNGLNPSVNDRNGDIDGDGLSNLREFQLGTRANVADTDGDGMPDGWEVRYGFNPSIAAPPTRDTDGDGLTDLAEFAAGTNPLLPDTDGDGIPDSWEVRYGLNALVNDASADGDGDGVANLQEYLLGRNPTRGAVADSAGVVNLRLYTPRR